MAKKKRGGSKKNTKRRSSGGGGGKRRRSSSGGGKRRRSGGGEGMIGAARMSGTETLVAAGTAVGLTLAARANAKAKKEGKTDDGAISLYRKLNVVGPVGIAGTIALGAAGASYFLDLKLAKPIAIGAAIVAGVQIVQNGGFFKKEQDSSQQGQLAVAGVPDELAMGAEVLDESTVIDA
jgi:hypothetical protein